ncbi:MAG: TIGR00730 family Rossman fold protein [Rhizomicrobium sp.]|jgi:uncharacterized protein (TIGR00730 family)
MADRNTAGHMASATSGNASPNDRAERAGKGRLLSICVFCGSSYGNDPAYAEAARDLGRLIGEGGHRLVFGGGTIGLMGEVARAARAAGADVIGVIPEFLKRPEIAFEGGTELIVAPTLQDRKTEMMERANAFVLLPGGLGTMDEYFEVITTAQLSQHRKPIVLIDVNGYFEPLRLLIDHLVSRGFVRPEARTMHASAATAADALRIIGSQPASS